MALLPQYPAEITRLPPIVQINNTGVHPLLPMDPMARAAGAAYPTVPMAQRLLLLSGRTLKIALN